MARFLRAFLDQPARCAGATAPRGRRAQSPETHIEKPSAEVEIKKGRRVMNASATPDAYGTLIEPTTLKIQRLLPGPVERIWAYLTDSELRRKWLAAGEMEMKVGAPFELVWRNDELTDPPGPRPPGFGDEHRMQSRITELDPPRKLAIAWEGSGDVSFELEPKGDQVLLTVIHRRLPKRATLLTL